MYELGNIDGLIEEVNCQWKSLSAQLISCQRNIFRESDRESSSLQELTPLYRLRIIKKAEVQSREKEKRGDNPMVTCGDFAECPWYNGLRANRPIRHW